MASPPPPGPPLDTSPPAPTPAGPGSPPLVAGPGAATAADPQQAARQQLQQVMNLGNEVDRAMLALTQVLGDTGSAEVGQARQLLQAGIAKYAAARAGEGNSGALSPVSVGNRFPGGGFSSQK